MGGGDVRSEQVVRSKTNIRAEEPNALPSADALSLPGSEKETEGIENSHSFQITSYRKDCFSEPMTNLQGILMKPTECFP